jgi:putative tricarboxylic transport membrane protein
MLEAVRQPKDLLAGLIFIVFSGLFLLDASNYAFGNVRRMGPGWFPTMVSILLIAIGAAIVAKSFFGRREAPPSFAWQPLAIILVSLAAFTVLLRPAGVIPAVFALVMISAFAYRPVDIWPMAGAALGLALFCAIVFVNLLGLPMPKLGPYLDQIVDPALASFRIWLFDAIRALFPREGV